jgi:hypothetical protein
MPPAKRVATLGIKASKLAIFGAMSLARCHAAELT